MKVYVKTFKGLYVFFFRSKIILQEHDTKYKDKTAKLLPSFTKSNVNNTPNSRNRDANANPFVMKILDDILLLSKFIKPSMFIKQKLDGAVMFFYF